MPERYPTAWRLTLRRLCLAPSERYEFSLLVVHPTISEKEALLFAKSHIHTPAWWDEYLILSIEDAGAVWAAAKEITDGQ